MNATLLQPLPFPEPERLVMLWEASVKDRTNFNIVSMPNYRDWLARSRSFESIGLMDSAGQGYSLTGQGEAERITGTPRHRELLPRARHPADARPHVPEGRGGRRPRPRRRPQPRVVDAPLRRRPRDRRQDHPDRRQGARRRRRHARVVRLRIRHPPRSCGCRSAGRKAIASRDVELVHRHRPPEARCHDGAGAQRDGHDRPRAVGGVPARERRTRP